MYHSNNGILSLYVTVTIEKLNMFNYHEKKKSKLTLGIDVQLEKTHEKNLPHLQKNKEVKVYCTIY